jgi:hypothetical protein
MHEHGIALGVCTNRIVLGGSNSKKRQTYIQSPENRERVSIIETINATGHYIRPLVMCKGKHLQTSWFSEENIPDWHISTTSKGWTFKRHCTTLTKGNLFTRNGSYPP